MPWKVAPVSEIRLAFVHHVRSLNHSVADACRRFGISRKTGYKWLARYQADPDLPLQDLSKRPLHSPRRTSAAARTSDPQGPRRLSAGGLAKFMLSSG